METGLCSTQMPKLFRSEEGSGQAAMEPWLPAECRLLGEFWPGDFLAGNRVSSRPIHLLNY